MLQSVVKQVLRRGCKCCSELSYTRNIKPIPQGWNSFSCNGFHMSSVRNTLESDVRNKKQLLKEAELNKLENTVSLVEEDIDLSECDELFPTLETHEMLVNGIKYKELPIAFIRASPNNTIITITDHTRTEVLGHSSCGKEGFKNVKKSTTVAAQATGVSVGYKVHRKGINDVRVIVKGIGVGGLPAITGLQQSGLNIVSLTDNTPVFSNGPKPRKAPKK